MDEIRTANAPETHEKKSRGLGSYVVWAFVAVMVYVLSSGPVVLMAQKSKLRPIPLPYPVLNIIYAPLNWAYNATCLHKPLGIYFHMWASELYDKEGEPIYGPRTH